MGYNIAQVKQDQRLHRGVVNLYGGNRKFWQCKDHEVILSGPAETGKTWAACHKLDAVAWKYPGVQIVIGRKVYTSLRGSVLQTFERVIGAWDPDFYNSDDDTTGGFNPSKSPIIKIGGSNPQFYDYPHGSRIWCLGLDNPQKILSSERDIIYINQAEEIDLSDWETMLTRVTGRGGSMPYAQLLGDANPGPKNHWILDRHNRGKLTLIPTIHEDNPTLFDPLTGDITDQGKRTMSVLDSLTGVRYLRLRKGIWASAEGMVYEGYLEGVHLIEPFPIPPSWTRFIVIDFGFVNPMVVQWWAESPTGEFYLYRELYHSQILVQYFAEAVRLLSGVSTILSLSNPFNGYLYQNSRSPFPEPIFGAFSDHDAEDSATLKAYGVNTYPAKKNLLAGIEECRNRLTIIEQGGQKKAGVYFFKGARAHPPDPVLLSKHYPTSTVEEFESYVYPDVGASRVRNEKEAPLDRHNHGMDCFRYLFSTLFLSEVTVERAYRRSVLVAPEVY